MLDSEITIEKMKSARRSATVALQPPFLHEHRGGMGQRNPENVREAKEYGLREPELIDMGSDFRINLYRKDAVTDQNGVMIPKA